MWYNLCVRLSWNIECSIYFNFLKLYLYFLKTSTDCMYIFSQVILLASMCFLNFWDRPIFKEVMNIYVMLSQSFCENTYVTPKAVWSWDWRLIWIHDTRCEAKLISAKFLMLAGWFISVRFSKFHDFSRKFYFFRFSRPCGNPVNVHFIWIEMKYFSMSLKRDLQ